MNGACDCPATTATVGGLARHNRADHAHDCRLPGNLRCGSCWGCVARLAAAHQVLASRGRRS